MNNKTENNKKVNKKVLIATVDISKNSHVGYWRYNGDECKPFTFSNSRKGFNHFWYRIRKAQLGHDVDGIIVGLESTGPYGKALIHYLRTKPVEVVLINPVHTKRLKELNGNSPLKSDRKDPLVIADVIQLHHSLSIIVPTGAAADLRELAHKRENLVVLRAAEYNRLQNLLSVLFPEFMTIMKNIKRTSALYLLDHYPTPEAIKVLGVKKLTRLLHRVSRGQLGCERARILCEAADHSIGVTEGKASMAEEVRDSIERIALYTRQIARKEERMNHYLSEIPVSRYLLSIKGVSTVTVACIIGEVGDFNSFNSQKAIIKFAGLNLYEISSGKHKGSRHITKRGRHLLRKILFFAAINVVRKGGILHEYYLRRIERKMNRIKALTAVTQKLLRIMYALARDKTNYKPGYSYRKAA